MYLKKQISKQEAMKFLENKVNIMNQHTTEQDKLNDLYRELESGAELLMIVGLKSRVCK